MSKGRRDMTPADAVWLYSEWEKNHQTVSGVMWTDRRIELEDYKAILQERLVDVYPVFRKKAVMSRNPLLMPHWEFDENFDIDNHIHEVQLPEPGDKATLERLVGEQRSQLLDRDRPLWEVFLMQGYNGDTSAVHSRFQHSIADGWSLVRLILSMADDEGQGERVNVVDKEIKRKRDRLASVAKAPVAAAAGGVGSAVGSVSGLVGGADVANDSDAAQESITVSEEQTSLVEAGAEVSEQLVANLTNAADSIAATVGGAVERLSLHASDVVKLADLARRGVKDGLEYTLPTMPGKNIFLGKPSGTKLVRWIDPIPLSDIKAIGKPHGATINDALMAILTTTLRTYLLERDALDVDELATMVPVSLRRPDDPLPRTLGNKFGLVTVMLPVGIEDPVEQMKEIKSQIDDIKSSTMPVVSFGLTSVSATFTPSVERMVHKLNQAETIGVTTNVPGPRHAISLAGANVLGMWGMGGVSGNMNLSFGIFSLNGELNFSINADEGITDDPDRIIELFLETVEVFKERTGVSSTAE